MNVMKWRARMAIKHETITIKLPNHSYKILIGSCLIDQIGVLVGPQLNRKKVVIITEETVRDLYLLRLETSLDSASIRHETLTLRPGEASKSWDAFIKTVEWLIEKRIERDDLIIALGGGVIGDLVGFAASVVRRGVPVVQVPTTLLSQVDSSVGGKTAINSLQGKNLIGTFHQPSLVVADTSLLGSLSRRDFRSGYSELVKYGLLGDVELYEWLTNNGEQLLKGDERTTNLAVKKACTAKARIVMADEKEKGQRALLNLGHTFGHALEAATNYSDRLLHGEAVSIGCVLAFRFSNEIGLCSSNEVDRVTSHFKFMGLKTDINDIVGELPRTEHFVQLMLNDKKVKSGSLNLILVYKIGSAFIAEDVSLSKVSKFLFKYLG